MQGVYGVPLQGTYLPAALQEDLDRMQNHARLQQAGEELRHMYDQLLQSRSSVVSQGVDDRVSRWPAVVGGFQTFRTLPLISACAAGSYLFESADNNVRCGARPFSTHMLTMWLMLWLQSHLMTQNTLTRMDSCFRTLHQAESSAARNANLVVAQSWAATRAGKILAL